MEGSFNLQEQTAEVKLTIRIGHVRRFAQLVLLYNEWLKYLETRKARGFMKLIIPIGSTYRSCRFENFKIISLGRNYINRHFLYLC